ncbi:MAG: hypothetical protein Q8R06_21760 [Polaromonas sp.]|uniref:hypothetical protein n=1 Tax=Polaromonas sp. TaxID=1869339 RepID=UPI002733B2D0|nr:hypothetical protein [Polaromonas sp.]MDP3799737.1 hypothetical protein [Polaromonas sp.]
MEKSYKNSGVRRPRCLAAEGGAQIISGVIVICDRLFGDKPDITMREGLIHAEWDSAGNTVVLTDQDAEGGGATATATVWMRSLVNGLQIQLAGVRDEAGKSYARISIGYQYESDGFDLSNGAKGFVCLKWTDENLSAANNDLWKKSA